MAHQSSLIAGVAVLASLVAEPVCAADSTPVRIPNQTVSIDSGERLSLRGVFQDGEYAGVAFLAVADPSLPFPSDYRPESLLAKLDPSLEVASVGSPQYNGPKSREEILSALPQSAFRLKSLIAADGQRAVTLGEPPVVVYVAGYKTGYAGYPPRLEDVKDPDFVEHNTRVYISAFDLAFSDLPSCSRYRGLCRPQN